MKAMRIHETGGADKLRWEDVPVPEPRAGEVRIRVEASGVNFIDTYQRSGLYPVTLPFGPGSEVAGRISAVGPDVTGFQLGDHVATAKAAGGYAEEAVAPAAQVVFVPSGVSSPQAASVLLQGMTAHYLTHATYPLAPGHNVLLHAAAGGVGVLLAQIARRRGARVLGVVGSDAKVPVARGAGADEVIVLSREDFTAAARRFSGGQGVDVVYDSVGKDTFEGSLASLRPRGMLVSYGNSSGAVPPFAPLLLAQKGSLFFTRPTLAHYTQNPAELQARADDLFRWLRSGELRLTPGSTFPLSGAADAQRALEGRATTGKVLLLP